MLNILLVVNIFTARNMLFLDLLGTRIASLTTSLKVKQCNSTFDKISIKKCLKDLHSKYIITPIIDKAANNVAFICKRFYAMNLAKELGITTSNPEQTYFRTNKTRDQIIKKHIKEAKKTFQIDISEPMNVLPIMYWTPKMHKTPSKARYIVAAAKCTNKALAKDITSVLKLFYRQIENYNAKMHKMSNIKTFGLLKIKILSSKVSTI